MRGLLRLLVILIVVEAVLFAARRIGRLLSAARTNPPQSTAGGHLVKDPVCGTYIPAETALQARSQFFCSELCRAKYLAG